MDEGMDGQALPGLCALPHLPHDHAKGVDVCISKQTNPAMQRACEVRPV
jgi:hypothetical protein